MTGIKKRYSRLLAGNWHFFCCGGKFSLRPEKKDTLRPEKKKDTVVCLMGARFWRLRPEKKKIQSSVWRVVLCNEFVLVLVKIDLKHF